jgi:glycosyltransferase involved in cell wall biosynthesis
MPRLSVVMIVKNEEKNLPQALASVRFADEIVVVDSGSTDRTLEIARTLGAKVYTKDWQGFGPQKQWALEQATGDWVLSLDADERVTPELQREILSLVTAKATPGHPATPATAGGPAGYKIPRLTYVLGKPVRHGGWYPDHVLRLFKRNLGRFSEDLVHEKILVQGPVGILKSDLLHESYTSYEQIIEKFNVYSTLGAKKLALRNPIPRGGVGVALGRATFAFIKSYFLKRGFLDGGLGFVLAVTSAESAFYKYLKLPERGNL